MTATATRASVRDASLLLQLSAAPQPLKRKFGHARIVRCGNCLFCAQKDCGECASCLDKRKFGGEGKRKQACLRRTCVNPLPAKS